MTIAKYLLGAIPRQAETEGGAGEDAAALAAAAEAGATAGNAGDGASGGAGESADAAAAGDDQTALEATEQAAAAAAQAAAKAKGQKAPKWAMERLAEETRAKQALAAELERERAEKQRLAELAERLQAAGKEPGKDGVATAKTSVPVIPPERFDAEVQRRAEQLLFTQDCNAVAAAGHAAFPDFGETLGILNAVGATSDEFLQDIIATDKAAAPALMRELAANPERAKQLVTMTSRQRVAELVRMSIPLNQNNAGAPAKPANVLSKAPAPKAAIAGQASRDEGGLNDTIGDEEFSRRWDDKYMRANRANGAAA